MIFVRYAENIFSESQYFLCFLPFLFNFPWKKERVVHSGLIAFACFRLLVTFFFAFIFMLVHSFSLLLPATRKQYKHRQQWGRQFRAHLPNGDAIFVLFVFSLVCSQSSSFSLCPPVGAVLWSWLLEVESRATLLAPRCPLTIAVMHNRTWPKRVWEKTAPPDPK